MGNLVQQLCLSVKDHSVLERFLESRSLLLLQFSLASAFGSFKLNYSFLFLICVFVNTGLDNLDSTLHSFHP